MDNTIILFPLLICLTILLIMYIKEEKDFKSNNKDGFKKYTKSKISTSNNNYIHDTNHGKSPHLDDGGMGSSTSSGYNSNDGGGC